MIRPDIHDLSAERLEEWESYAAAHPLDYEAIFQIARIHFAARRWDAATHFCVEALAVRSDFLPAHRGLLLCALRGNDSGALQEGLQGMERALAGDPEHEVTIGATLAELGQHQDALQYFRRHLEKHPGCPQALVEDGMAHYHQSEWAEAEEAFRAAVQAGGDNVAALVPLAAVLCELRRPEEALPLALRAVALAPENAEAHQALGLCYAAAGQRDEARRQIELLRRLDPLRAAMIESQFDV